MTDSESPSPVEEPIDVAALQAHCADLERQLAEAHAQQDALRDVLGIIASAPTDLTAVFQTIADNVMRLCHFTGAGVWRVEGNELVQVKGVGFAAARFRHRRVPIDSDTLQGRAIVEQRVIYNEDLDLAPTDDVAAAKSRRGGLRSVLSVPLLNGNQAYGTLNVGAHEVTPLSERQIILAQAFAEQGVIAIQNARRIEEIQSSNSELRQALDQQTATSEVLSAISRSAFDLKNVLDTLVQSAMRLCAADSGHIGRVDGDAFRYDATFSSNPDLVTLMRGVISRPNRGTAMGRALVERRPVHIADVLLDPEYSALRAQQVGGYRTALAIPLLRGGELIGAFTLTRSQPEAFTDAQIKLVTTFADQAVIAITNAELFQQLQERNRDLSDALAQQRAISEILQMITNSPTDVQPVLQAIVDQAEQLPDVTMALLALYLGNEAVVRARGPRTTAALARGQAVAGDHHPLVRQNMPGRVFLERRTIHLVDPRAHGDPMIPTSTVRRSMRALASSLPSPCSTKTRSSELSSPTASRSSHSPNVKSCYSRPSRARRRLLWRTRACSSSSSTGTGS